MAEVSEAEAWHDYLVEEARKLKWELSARIRQHSTWLSPQLEASCVICECHISPTNDPKVFESESGFLCAPCYVKHLSRPCRQLRDSTAKIIRGFETDEITAFSYWFFQSSIYEGGGSRDMPLDSDTVALLGLGDILRSFYDSAYEIYVLDEIRCDADWRTKRDTGTNDPIRKELEEFLVANQSKIRQLAETVHARACGVLPRVENQHDQHTQRHDD